jgi:cellobiose phosphorylase
MYRLIVESLVGLQLEVDRLRITPCVPASWPSFQVHYRFRETFYHISIESNGDSNDAIRLTLDGLELPDDYITLVNDGRDHQIHVVSPSRVPSASVESQ